MDLIANGLYRATCSPGEVPGIEPGLYRVILNDLHLPRVVMVYVQSEDQDRRGKGGRKPRPEAKLRRQRKRPPAKLVGKLLWIPRSQLEQMCRDHVLMPIEQDRPLAPALGDRSKAEYERRLVVMSGFLNVQKLQESILVHEGLSGLVDEAVDGHGCSRSFVYSRWSDLCRWGISERSLWPQRHRCGAPGKPRTCDLMADGQMSRRKAGRKTLEERIDIAYGRPTVPEQPGISEVWAAKVRAADQRIPTPKPAWPTRCTQIMQSAFLSRAKEVDGKIELVLPEMGHYPNRGQIRRVVYREMSQLERILEKTTRRHFDAARRGLVARNWQGVAGPGHTWAIDSTIGDIYLRSSVCREWIVGRPVVYVIVDIWSTAVVGFYVCLTGPSWNTAKVSIFNASADPALVSGFWGSQTMLTLDPAPTLCATLMCDRGEYLSAAHRTTALSLEFHSSYAPPYRGDLKGLVEVLHRIQKDQLFLFIPGAMNYRREEMELRRINPADAVLTVQEYVQVLYEVFAKYNLTADRSKRVDVHMTAAGVYPSPAGLWRYGHQMGIGFRREVHFDDLATSLLGTGKAWVARDAVHFAGNDYMSDDVKAQQWTAIARNLGGREIDTFYYPGSMGQIWVPRIDGGNLMRLDLTDESRAVRSMTFDEWADASAAQTLKGTDIEHQRVMQSVQALERIKALSDRAAELTGEALSKASGKAPTMSEARAIEVAMTGHPSHSESATREAARDEVLEEHESMMAVLLDAANARGGSHV